jgi:hypothetical protein
VTGAQVTIPEDKKLGGFFRTVFGYFGNKGKQS